MRWAAVAVLALASALALAQGYAPRRSTSGSSAVSPEDVLGVVQDAGTLTRADRDTYANAFVASATSPDGGVAAYSFLSNQRSCIKPGPGPQEELCVSNPAELTVNFGLTKLSNYTFQAAACRPNEDCYLFSDSGYWVRFFPASSVTGCDAASEGGVKANSTTHRLEYCNGTASYPVGTVIGPAAYLVDFPEISSGGVGTTTVTVTGAAVGDGVIVNPCGTLEDDLGGLQGRVSATNTVTIRGRNFDGTNPLNPAACSYVLTVVKQ